MRLKSLVQDTPLEAPARAVLRAVRRRVGGTPLADPPPPRTFDATELRLLHAASREGGRKDAPSVLFFTTHKCASTFSDLILQAACAESGMRHVDYLKSMWRLGNHFSAPTSETAPQGEEAVFLKRHTDLLFSPLGEVYGPLRKPVPVPGFSDYRTIFFLRDPRDVLVSAYHSFGFSHPLPPNDADRAALLAERARMQAEGIDAYALRAAEGWLRPVLNTYAQMRRSAEDSLFVRYDDYVADPGAVIRQVFDLVGADTASPAVDRLAAEASPVREAPEGDAPRHKRSGRSGQFRAELKDDTVRRLDDVLSDALAFWGFDG